MLTAAVAKALRALLNHADAEGFVGMGFKGVAGYMHISRYAFEPHTHEAFGIGVIEQGAERFRYRGSQHIAAANSIVTMNPDELQSGSR